MAANAMRTRHADFHQGQERLAPTSKAEYTQAIRPCSPSFFQNVLATGGSPYTLLGGMVTHRNEWIEGVRTVLKTSNLFVFDEIPLTPGVSRPHNGSIVWCISLTDL